MPIYEYQCESCGEIVENWQKITDPPLEKCESCGGKMKKLISQSTFQLKGSGWYVTDYANKKTENKAKKPEKKDNSSSKSSSTSASASSTK